MIELVLFGIVGAVLLLVFVLLVLTRHRKASPDRVEGALEQIVRLPGLSFESAHLVFDDKDYRLLRSSTILRPLARRLREDRRRMVVLWLGLLRDDLVSLWRFRRLLTRSGVSAGLTEELRIAVAAILALVLLLGLRVFVVLAGPFALSSLVGGVRYQVESVRKVCEELLKRAPHASLDEIQRKWTSEMVAPGNF